MKWSIDDLPIFAAVVKQKGITAAAEYLNTPKSTVSRSITRLENALGVRLLERNSRNIRLTHDGEAFYQHSLLILEQVEEANNRMAGLTAVPSGQLTVALPMAFAREIVAPKLNIFLQQYPDVRLEIIITSRDEDPIQDHIDIAVVIGSQPDSDLIAQPLTKSTLVWICSADYYHNNHFGTHVEDLTKHLFIGEKRYCKTGLQVLDHGDPKTIEMTELSCLNDVISVQQAIAGGAGVSMVPSLYCKEQLKNGSLVQVYHDIAFDSDSALITALYPSRRCRSNKTKAFLDFLKTLTE